MYAGAVAVYGNIHVEIQTNGTTREDLQRSAERHVILYNQGPGMVWLSPEAGLEDQAKFYSIGLGSGKTIQFNTSQNFFLYGDPSDPDVELHGVSAAKARVSYLLI